MLEATIQRYRTAYAGLPREVWVLALVLLVNRAGAMVLAFLTLYLTKEIAMSEAAAGQMISLYGLGSIVGVYIGGRIIDRVGAVRVQTICMFLAVPGLLSIPMFRDPIAIGVAVFLLAVASEAVRPANATAIAKITPPADRMRAFALQRLAANLGFSIGPAIGGLLATISYPLLFIADAATTCIAAFLLLGYFRMRRLPGEAVDPRSLANGASPIQDHQFVVFLALLLASSIVFFQFLSTYTLYLRDHYGLVESQIGKLFAVNTIVIVIFEMVLIDYVKRWPLLRTIGWGSFLSCLGFGLLPFGSGVAFAVFAMLVLTVGEMLSMPLSTGYVASRAPVGGEGRYMGWLTMTFSLAFVLGPAIGSAVYAVNRDAVWYACLTIGFLVLVGFYQLPTSRLEGNEDSAYEEELDGIVSPRDEVAEMPA